MANFDKAFDFALLHEDPKRTGKTTTDNNGARVRYGLNEASNPELTAEGFYDTMSKDDALIRAKTQYNMKYWASIRGDEIKDDGVGAKIFDMAINMGALEAIKLAQRSAEMMQQDLDGKIGPHTLGAINAMDSGAMLTNLVAWWNWFIGEEVKNKPQDINQVKGWRARANDLPQEGEAV